MGKRFLLPQVFLVFLFLGAKPVLATMTIESSPSLITESEEFLVFVSLSGLSKNTDYFLKGAFYATSSGTPNYFGKTFNNETWVKNSDSFDKQLKITTSDEGEWQGDVKCRVDKDDSGYLGPGLYNFKIGRYTASGSGPTWSGSKVLEVVKEKFDPSPTPTPTPTLSPTPLPTPSPTPTTSPTPSPWNGEEIFLSEFMPNPSEGEEWVEIKSENDFEVNLVGWYIDDVANGGSAPFKFSLAIPAQGYGVVYISTRLNNTGDTLRLLKPDESVFESYSYPLATKGLSFAKDESGNWHETSDPTPGEANSIVLPSTPTPSPTPSPSPISTSPPTPSPSPTPLGSSPVLGLFDQPSAPPAQPATDSGYLVDFMCRQIEGLEETSQALKPAPSPNSENNNGNLGPFSKFVAVLSGLMLAGSLGSFIKEAGLVKWFHGVS